MVQNVLRVHLAEEDCVVRDCHDSLHVRRSTWSTLLSPNNDRFEHMLFGRHLLFMSTIGVSVYPVASQLHMTKRSLMMIRCCSGGVIVRVVLLVSAEVERLGR